MKRYAMVVWSGVAFIAVAIVLAGLLRWGVSPLSTADNPPNNSWVRVDAVPSTTGITVHEGGKTYSLGMVEGRDGQQYAVLTTASQGSTGYTGAVKARDTVTDLDIIEAYETDNHYSFEAIVVQGIHPGEIMMYAAAILGVIQLVIAWRTRKAIKGTKKQ